jgi:predicted RecB family nuclease
VTLLSFVTASKADEHLNGIESIAELATAIDLDSFGLKAATRAQVWIDKVPVLLDPTKEFGLPAFDVEIDIDLENSQAAMQEEELEDSAGRDVLYLYGYGIHDRTVDPDWRTAVTGFFDDYSDTDETEFRIFSQMWSLLEEEVARAEAVGKSIGVFHYGPYEQTWWRKFANLHTDKKGTPTLEHVEAFMRRYFVNLLPIARKVALPVTGYSIKTLAPFAGFNWEVAEAGGANSMIMYQRAISPTTTAGEKADAIDWLRRYNRDDIRATFAVREYLRELEL